MRVLLFLPWVFAPLAVGGLFRALLLAVYFSNLKLEEMHNPKLACKSFDLMRHQFYIMRFQLDITRFFLLCVACLICAPPAWYYAPAWYPWMFAPLDVGGCFRALLPRVLLFYLKLEEMHNPKLACKSFYIMRHQFYIMRYQLDIMRFILKIRRRLFDLCAARLILCVVRLILCVTRLIWCVTRLFIMRHPFDFMRQAEL